MAAMGAKLGLHDRRAGDDDLVTDLLDLMTAQRVDYSTFFRALASGGLEDPAFAGWIERWSARLGETGDDRASVAAAMNGVNPVYVPRNHLVEEALTAATAGDLEPFDRLVDVLSQPFQRAAGTRALRTPRRRRLRRRLPDVLRHLIRSRGSERLRVVAADFDALDVGAEVGLERPVGLLAGDRRLDPPAVVATDALVADERPRLALVGPVVGLQPMTLDELGDGRVASTGPPEVVGELEPCGAFRRGELERGCDRATTSSGVSANSLSAPLAAQSRMASAYVARS